MPDRPTELASARVTVMGLGRFGGGLGVVRYLASAGAEVLVTDTAGEAQLAEPLEAIDDLVRTGAVQLRLGGHNVADFTTTDLVIANPAVPTPWNNRFLRAAEAAGVPVTTEIELALDLIERSPGLDRTIAVTGSAGKSTTSAMIHAGLQHAGVNAILGGNIGGSLLESPDPLPHAEAVVLELSSAQLHWLHARPRLAAVAVITGFEPNHLDWHGTLDHYRECKQSLAAKSDRTVLGPTVADWPAPARTNITEPTELDLRLPGAHNRLNAALALAALGAFGLDPDAARTGVASFEGLPHRLRRLDLARLNDAEVTPYDDSKSTTPKATALALRALAEAGHRRIHLIAGGADKGVDLAPMFANTDHLAGVYAIGATAEHIQRLHTDAVVCGTLEAAIERIADRARTGDAVLLSPGCASWDQFDNYVQRGQRFAELLERRSRSS